MVRSTHLIVGATGATGKLLVAQLLEMGQSVKAIVRSLDTLPEPIRHHPHLQLIHSSILNLSDMEIAQHVKGCSTVISCLGHTLSIKGIYGQPRRLVTNATTRLCEAIQSNETRDITKFVLMNTAGNSNRDLAEPISFSQKCVIGFIRLLLPPHLDNEMAADYLRLKIGQNSKKIEWVVVRPDTLINEEQVSKYEVFPSPTRSAIFNAGKTSRINVAHFMAKLVTEEKSWVAWKGKMPVIYNSGHE